MPRFSSLNTGIFVHFLSGPVEPFVEILAVDPPRNGDEALSFQFLVELTNDMDMTFEAFVELYTKDVRPRLKENTWLTKENIRPAMVMKPFPFSSSLS